MATPIRPAAVGIVVVPAAKGAGWRTLLIQRHAKARFLRNAFAFPGGCVDDGADTTVRVPQLRQAGLAERGVPTGTPGLVLDDFRRCAIREVQEETGVRLHVTGIESATLVDHGASTTVGGAMPLVATLRPWAHWTTPASERYRYNTWFFVAVCPDVDVNELPTLRPDATEISGATWIAPDVALRRHATATSNSTAGAAGAASEDVLTLPLTPLLILEHIATVCPSFADVQRAVEAYDPNGSPDAVARLLPAHVSPVCRVDACGVKHWHTSHAAAPHVVRPGSYAYQLAADTYASDALGKGEHGGVPVMLHVA